MQFLRMLGDHGAIHRINKVPQTTFCKVKVAQSYPTLGDPMDYTVH